MLYLADAAVNVLDLRSGGRLPRSRLRLDLPGRAPSVRVTGVPGSLFAAYSDVIDENSIHKCNEERRTKRNVG
jgi:hypothetical protein